MSSPSALPQRRKAKPLCPGDTIGIVAPSMGITPAQMAQAVARVQSWGYRALPWDVTRGYPFATEAERADAFNQVWSNPAVDGILCARGGYGTMGILPHLDWELIQAQPKFFCGFSDITALHLAMEKKAGLVTFHGPMAWAFGKATTYNTQNLLRAMGEAGPLGEIPWPETGGRQADSLSTPVVIRSGIAEGVLTGGNLTLLCSLMGTPYEPDFSHRIVMMEEVGEAPYRIDRMLAQLLLAGKLQQAAGILFGQSISCDGSEAAAGPSTVLEVLADRLAPLGIPVLYGFPCGHGAYRATLPLGVHARLDAGAACLKLLEPALKG